MEIINRQINRVNRNQMWFGALFCNPSTYINGLFSQGDFYKRK